MQAVFIRRETVASDRVICYVSSLDYLLPSIVSAAGVRRFVPNHKADIVILLTTEDESRLPFINRRLGNLGIHVEGVGAVALKQINSFAFDGYINSTTLGRFFIADLLPIRYQKIVYIDGDTMVSQDPTALVEADVPEGRIAAAEDVISFRRSRLTPAGRRILAYHEGLGIGAGGYFNSGILAVTRKTWRLLAEQAFAFFKQHRSLCVCLDQSALNAVTGDRRLPLSLKWNFQSPARFLGIEGLVSPTIYHFNQYIKPWMGLCKPWEHIHHLYRTESDRFTALELTLPMVSEADIQAHNRLTPVKNALLQWPALASLASRHTDVRAYERTAWI